MWNRRGLGDFLHAIALLILLLARHWFTAIPLLLWPELLAVAMVLTADSANTRHAAAWSAWLVVVLIAQAAGIWISSMKGWASADDLPAVVVSALLSSIPGAMAGMWFFQLVADTRERRAHDAASDDMSRGSV
jgi:hypothetical protein